MPLQIVEVADTGIGSTTASFRFPVATNRAVYWFPTDTGGSVLKYDIPTDTVTLIPTGVPFGWNGAIQGDDGNIYAVPNNTHRTVLRITPSTDAVATTTYSSLVTPDWLGVPSSVVVGGQQRIYAFPARERPLGGGGHRTFLRIDCDTFTASTWTGTGAASVNQIYGDSIAHPNGRIYLSPKGNTGNVIVLDPSTDTFAGVSTGGRSYSAMVLRNFTTTSPIYLFGASGFAKLALTPAAAVTPITGGDVSAYYSGDARYGRRPALLMANGNIVGVPTANDDATVIDTGSDTASVVVLSELGWTSGGALGGNGKGYWFDQSGGRNALEYDPATNSFTIIIPDTLDPRAWGEPVNVGGNVYVLSDPNVVEETLRVGVIQLATPPTAIIVATPTTGSPPLMVAFDGTTSLAPAGGIYAYAWDFGDGNTSTSPSPIHTYLTAGTYTVTLTIVDIVGQSDTATVQIRVRGGRRGLGLVKGGSRR
jgi:hypothetical protein